MRTSMLVLALLLGIAAALVGCAATNYESPEPAGYDADYGYFYDALSPYGAWYDVAPYGWVWSPYDIPVGWRPYTDGHWIYTDYGWTWLSDDAWGWAPYHYGRWAWDRYYGWIWVPGDVWAPAWVAWRYGDGYVGWAPLPPDVGWGSSGLTYGSYDVDHISQYRWSFCKEEDFTTTRVRTVVLPRSRNVTLLGVTKDATRYDSWNGRPVIRGFDSDMLERDLNRPVTRYQVTDAPGVGRDRAAVVRGDAVEMYRPKIAPHAPKGERTPPNARNRAGEEQRLEERNKARDEARRQRAQTEGGQTDASQGSSQRERSEIQPPGRKNSPNVQAPAPSTKPAPRPGSKPAPVAETEPATPPPATSQAEAQRRDAEQKELEDRIQAQRQALKQEQQKDLKDPPPGVSPGEIQRRHVEEQKAQNEVEKRDREELRNREELRRQWEEQQRQAQQAREQARQKAEEKRQREEQKQERKEEKEQRKEQKQQPDQGQNQLQGQDRGQPRER